MSELISPPMDAVAPLYVSTTSYSTHPIKTTLANGITRRSSSVAEASDDPASTSTDIGLRLLLEAMIERGERFQYMDTQVFCEATVSMDLTMGQAPSFLDDICTHFQFSLFVRFQLNFVQWIYPFDIHPCPW